jgi:hypothetical protein
MEEKGKTIKQYCKDAMKRLKGGFWEKYYASLDEKLKKAEQDGVSVTKVKDYYVEKVVNSITKTKDENEVFYFKVKNMLDSEGEVANAIGRLRSTDTSIANSSIICNVIASSGRENDALNTKSVGSMLISLSISQPINSEPGKSPSRLGLAKTMVVTPGVVSPVSSSYVAAPITTLKSIAPS